MATKTDKAWAEHALAALQEAGFKRGGARTAVVQALAGHSCAVTALDLDQELRRRKPAVGRASVYRALEQLEQLGLVQRLEVSRGTAVTAAAWSPLRIPRWSGRLPSSRRR
jgi:Fur family transcriptional regulator, ferric uptake regulator